MEQSCDFFWAKIDTQLDWYRVQPITTITHLSIGQAVDKTWNTQLRISPCVMKCEISNYHLSFTQIKPIQNR